MAHIGVHCTLHKMAMLKNGTYLCKLQLHVNMGSIIHFCTDTNTQNRTNFTKSLNTRFITENAKTSTFILFKILWTFHHHVSWQASELLFLHRSIAKFDQQKQLPCWGWSYAQNISVSSLQFDKLLFGKLVVFTEKKELELLLLNHSIAKFDQQSNFQIEDDIMHKTSVFQVYDLRNFCSEDW